MEFELSVLGAWLYGQCIYEADGSAMAVLNHESCEMTASAPLSLADFLFPEWCVYVKTPGMSFFGRNIHGFFACLDAGLDDGSCVIPRLFIALDAVADNGGMLAPVIIEMPGGNIEETLKTADPWPSGGLTEGEMKRDKLKLLFLLTNVCEKTGGPNSEYVRRCRNNVFPIKPVVRPIRYLETHINICT
jgi:hypothetical protein